MVGGEKGAAHGGPSQGARSQPHSPADFVREDLVRFVDVIGRVVGSEDAVLDLHPVLNLFATGVTLHNITGERANLTGIWPSPRASGCWCPLPATIEDAKTMPPIRHRKQRW